MTFTAEQIETAVAKAQRLAEENPATSYSPEELETMLVEMHRLATGIYPALTRIGCHPFIEFCGLMREYVKVCRYAYEHHGTQFPFASVHGTGMPTQPYHLKYLAEKLECIFSPMYMHSEANLVVFVEALFGRRLGLIPVRTYAKAWVALRVQGLALTAWRILNAARQS